MGRISVWIIVIALAAAGYWAISSRYVYSAEGTTRVRTDRWTGSVQAWECVALQTSGAQSAYFPTAPGADSDRPCARYGWKGRK